MHYFIHKVSLLTYLVFSVLISMEFLFNFPIYFSTQLHWSVSVCWKACKICWYYTVIIQACGVVEVLNDWANFLKSWGIPNIEIHNRLYFKTICYQDLFSPVWNMGLAFFHRATHLGAVKVHSHVCAHVNKRQIFITFTSLKPLYIFFNLPTQKITILWNDDKYRE